MQDTSPDTYRLIHCSDIHFHSFPKHPLQYCNKRIKGVLRQLLGCANFHANTLLQRFPHVVQQLHAEGMCITGDFSLTALDEEFIAAQSFVHQLQTLTQVFVLPGNHDVYTAQAFHEQTYYQYFPDEQLQTTRIACHKLTDHWWLLLLDCSYLNRWCSAHGEITHRQLASLQHLLQALPSDASLILANHYPLLPTLAPSHDLLNHSLLHELISQHPNIRIYLHGHDHRAAIHTEGPLTIINSGSLSLPSNACGHILELSSQGARVSRLQLTNLRQTSEPLEYTLTECLQLNTHTMNI